MNIQERKLENSRMEITVQVPVDRILAEYENSFKRIQKSAKLDGFRPGKAPIAMVKARFQERADQDVVESIVKDCYLEAVKEKDYHPISYPRFNFDRLETGKDFTFTASFDVPPTVELGSYKNISVNERQCAVSDDDVMEEINGVRENHAVISAKEEGRPVEKGDLAKIKVKRIDNIAPELIEAAEAREVTVLAGAKEDKFEFDPYVIGMNVGDTKDVVLTYPKDYQYKSVAGQTHTYRMALGEIQKRELPALDDEFAKDLSEYESLADMKKKIRERLESFVSEKGRGEAKADILKKIVEGSKFDLPETMIEEEKKTVLERLGQRIGYQFNSVAEIAPFFGMKPEDMDAKMREEALMSVKTSLVVAEIIKKESLTVTDEKFNEAVDDMAKRNGKTAEELKSMIEANNARGRLDSEILYNNAIDFVYEQAKVKKEKPIPVKEFMKPQA